MTGRPFSEASIENQANYLLDLIRVADRMAMQEDCMENGFRGLMTVIAERAEKLLEEIEKDGRNRMATF